VVPKGQWWTGGGGAGGDVGARAERAVAPGGDEEELMSVCDENDASRRETVCGRRTHARPLEMSLKALPSIMLAPLELSASKKFNALPLMFLLRAVQGLLCVMTLVNIGVNKTYQVSPHRVLRGGYTRWPGTPYLYVQAVRTSCT
jgi:hypothetical protein